MNKPTRKNMMWEIINNSLIDLPTPVNLNIWWNFGSILGLCLMIQLISGLIISMHYSANTELAFMTINHIMRNVNYGWLTRITHSNGASLMFICVYMHIGRGIYYSSFFKIKTWITGVMIMFIMMATAFLGYVLPWGQMSFWGATVITNLLSAIPKLGPMMVKWIWGGFSVSTPTLSRFFSMHFIMPFIMSFMVIIHLFFLHMKGSTNPIGLNSKIDKVPFHPYYSIKDLMGFSLIIMMLMMLNMSEPYMLSDPDNFTPANPMITPIHIQPEWYFLFAYAILRSIPNKLGGVISLVMSILIIIILPYSSKMKFSGSEFYPLNQMLFWTYVSTVMLLTWIGSRPVEEPFMTLSLSLTLLYFSYFISNPIMMKLWDQLIN